MKILFIDIDGTYIDYKGKLPSSARLAIKEVREKGHLVIFCTGRSRAEMHDYILEAGYDGLILGNGNTIEFNNDIIFYEPMSLSDTISVVDWLYENRLEFYMESNNGLFASENFFNQSLPVFMKYMGRTQPFTKEELDSDDFFKPLIYGENLYRNDVNKISFILNSYKNHTDSQRVFPHLKTSVWGGVGEEALFGDIGVKNISKELAIQKVLSHLKSERKDTIAFGDANIDIPMLEYCEIGVAMGNGNENSKKAADIIADDVNDDGLYKAFVLLGLI